MFDYDESFIVDKLNDSDDDTPLDCPTCDGQGRLIDFWGPMRCATCEGTGIIFNAGDPASSATAARDKNYVPISGSAAPRPRAGGPG